MLDRTDAEKIYEQDRDRFFAEWKQYLGFPSISSLSEYGDHSIDCAEWIRDHLTSFGMKADLIKTSGLPSVYAEWKGEPGLPTVVIYGHYDVQPVGPLDLWDHHPFEAVIKNGRMFARGARDNKGQHFFLIKALETLIMREELRCSIKLILDGEEESGSLGLMEKLPDLDGNLDGDILLACETSGAPNADPAIIAGLRGAVFTRFRLHGPAKELHSGNHGGRIRNPAIEITRLLGSVYNGTGKVAVKGFYDKVREPTPIERKLANSINFDEDKYKNSVGVTALGGEEGYTPVERVGFRPTIEINGISSGYTGRGIKTSIPPYASAVISMRLVPHQDPEECIELLRQHLEERLPDGLRLEGIEPEFMLGPFSCDLNDDAIKRAKRILDDMSITGDTCFRWVGASLPVIHAIVGEKKLSPLLVGFGLDGDNEHAPNESFSLDQFRKGFVFGTQFFSSFVQE